MRNTKMTKRVKKHLPYILLAIFIGLFISFGVRIYTGRVQHFIVSGDVYQLIALQDILLDQSMYERDVSIHAQYETYPRFGNTIVAKVRTWVGNTRLAYLLVSLLLHIAFLIGMYTLGYGITANKHITVLFTILAGYGQRAINGNLFGILSAEVLDRDFVLVIVPFLFWFFLKKIDRPKTLFLFFFVLGLLIYVHPLSAVYLAGIFVLIYFFYYLQQPNRLLYIFPYGAMYGIAAAAFLVPRLLSELTHVPAPYLHFRYPYIYNIDVSQSLLFLLLPISVGFLGYWFASKSLLSKEAQKKLTCTFLGIAVFVFGGLLVGNILTQYQVLQFDRASKFLYVPILLYCSLLLYYLITDKRSDVKKGIGFLLLLLLALPVGPFLAHAVAMPPKNKYADEQIGNFTIGELQQLAQSVEMDIIDSEEHREAFFSLTSWFQTETARDALVMVPPSTFGPIFRISSGRTVLANYDDLNIFILDVPFEHTEAYFTAYTKALLVYTQNATEPFIQLANEYDTEYIVVFKEKHNLTLPVEYQNDRYVVYSMSQQEMVS